MSPPSSRVETGLPSVEEFFRTIVRSGLMDQSELDEALQQVPLGHREHSRLVAEQFIRNGRLSRFQANKLLQGRASGLLFGDYQILALIGRGGIGTVYLVRDQRNGQLAALKILTPKRAKDTKRMEQRFQREMGLSRRVNHPNIAKSFEGGKWKEVYYLAMEFVPGKSLQRLVADEGPLPVARAARLMAEVASGLTHAHEQGLIHRDLKPSNIIITPHDHAKVLDFGLALLEGEEVLDPKIVGGKGYIVGSMDYIAPEQTFDATKVDGRADIYALGCTLYFTVTGQVPFPGGSKKFKIRRHRKEEPMSLLQIRPDMPRDFVKLVRSLMSKDPDQRPASATLAEQELRKFADSEALPMDQSDDAIYTQAVTSLREAEPVAELDWPEVIEEELSSSQVPIPVTPTSPPSENFILWLSLGLIAGLLLLAGFLLGVLIWSGK